MWFVLIVGAIVIGVTCRHVFQDLILSSGMAVLLATLYTIVVLTLYDYPLV